MEGCMVCSFGFDFSHEKVNSYREKFEHQEIVGSGTKLAS